MRCDKCQFKETITVLGAQKKKKMSNNEWIQLIAREFKVSRTTAKEMLHSMYAVKKLKTDSKIYSTYAESC